MKWVALAVVVALVMDRVLLAAERRGWIYYRKRKPTSGSASAAAFGPMAELFQPGQQVVVEERMAAWAAQAPDLAESPGAGAAGGLGFGLMLLGGRRVSGIDLVAQAVGLRPACAVADVVITGEGRFDWQSLHGKVVSGVREVATRVVVLAGQVDLPDSPVPAYSLLDFAGERAFSDPAAALADLAASVAASRPL